MNINRLSEIESKFSNYKEILDSGDLEKAKELLSEVLEAIEEAYDERRPATIDNDLRVTKTDEDGRDIFISLNHVMEYYVYACYFEPETQVQYVDIPVGDYYRTYGELCLRINKFHAAEDAYKKAICWNPVDLDSYLGLAECYKNLNMLGKYLEVTKLAYRYCCTRATMARYYRNMGFFNVASYKPQVGRVCYTYSNIYYKTDNADRELAFIKEATGDEEQELSIKEMQKVLDEENIEPGPDSKTIGIIYRAGEIFMEDGALKLARDCFSIVYDITREPQLEELLDGLEKAIGEEQ